MEIKVDSYFDFFDRCDSEIARLTKRKQDLERTIAALKKNKESITKVMMINMKSDTVMPDKSGKKFMKGLSYRVQLVVKKDHNVKVEPGINSLLDSQHYLKYRRYMKRTYAWDKTALKKAEKAGELPEQLDNLVDLYDSESLKWTVNKGIEK